MLHTEDRITLDAGVQNLVATATWRPEFVYLCMNQYKNMKTIIISICNTGVVCSKKVGVMRFNQRACYCSE